MNDFFSEVYEQRDSWHTRNAICHTYVAPVKAPILWFFCYAVSAYLPNGFAPSVVNLLERGWVAGDSHYVHGR